MWEAAYKFIYEHPYQLDLTYSRIKYPDNGLLEDMMLEYPTNIRISEDTLLFDAVVSCTVTLTVDGYRGMETAETSQWLVISCEAIVKDKLEKLTITEIKNYKIGKQRKTDSQAVSKNIVPILYKSDLDKEAEVFLARYYPEALERPTPVPIDTIAKALDDEGVPTKRGGKWTSTSVRGILSNEKYTGDVIFQKTYTDDSFNRHTNKGELDMYYVADHHEAIISKEDFEAAGLLITQRAAEKGIKRESQKYQQRYAFSGKIICNECGDTFRRRMHSSTYGKYVAWCCNTHLADKDKCSMLYLRDDDLKLAFVTVLNKLIYSHKLVLKPYAAALQNNSGDESLIRIQHLERLLEQNTEQRETLTRLIAQGYIDQVLYNSETNALLTQANTYREDIEVINATMSGDSSRFFEAERLLRFAERGSMLEEYSEDLFERFVDHIQVYSRHEVGFVMKCGLTFKEMI